MARLQSCGFELNATISQVDSVRMFNANADNSPSTAVVRSGSYALKTNYITGANKCGVLQVSSAGTKSWFSRSYLNIATLPANTTPIMCFFNAGTVPATTVPHIRLTTAGKLQLFNGTVQVGSDSTTLNTNQWYRIEMHVDSTQASGSQVLEGLIDGSSFANASNLTLQSTSYNSFYFGANLFQVAITNTGTLYWDDVALNDTSGSFQTGYPGAGSIIYQIPSGAGDSTQWTIGGSSPAATNWQSVNEIPPNDAVTLVNEALLNRSDFYTVGVSSIGLSDIVNLVQIGGRFNNDTADAMTSFQFQVQKVTGGTVVKSSGIIPNSTTWKTNNITTNVLVYPITLYQDPDGSNWTQSTINSMQIGIIAGAVGVNKAQVTSLWALVEYVPVTVSAATSPTLSLMGVG